MICNLKECYERERLTFKNMICRKMIIVLEAVKRKKKESLNFLILQFSNSIAKIRRPDLSL